MQHLVDRDAYWLGLITSVHTNVRRRVVLELNLRETFIYQASFFFPYTIDVGYHVFFWSNRLTNVTLCHHSWYPTVKRFKVYSCKSLLGPVYQRTLLSLVMWVS